MNELAIELKAEGEKCLYLQIYDYIRNEIRTGKLLRDEKLPSTRSLAEYLQVARSTVDCAYSQLLAEGYIISKPCRGYFVCGMEDILTLSFEEEKIRQQGRTTADCPPMYSYGKKEAGESDRQFFYDFSPNAISMRYFPFATWKRITREIWADGSREMFALGDSMGDYELRETISRYLHSSRGVNCSPEQIIVGAGNDYLLLLLEKILGRHVPIAMENPTYKRAYKIFQSFAYDIKTLPMDESGINMEALRLSEANVAYVMPSHQYPTGVVMPIGRRLELLKWASEKEERYLIEDDYDSEFRYKGKPIPCLQASDRQGKVIYMGTFSKSIAPAIRVGYMVLPQALLTKYRENCGFYASTVSRIDQQILNEFIRDGYFERYLNKMRKIYKEKHDFLLEQLKDFEKGFILSGENAGLHLLLTSKRNIPESVLIGAAQKEGIRVYGMSEALLDAEKGKSHTVLLGYGELEKEEIRQGIERLRAAWREYL